jgi:hypothetical protein
MIDVHTLLLLLYKIPCESTIIVRNSQYHGTIPTTSGSSNETEHGHDHSAYFSSSQSLTGKAFGVRQQLTSLLGILRCPQPTGITNRYNHQH